MSKKDLYIYKCTMYDVLEEIKTKYSFFQLTLEAYNFITYKVWNSILKLNADELIEVSQDKIRDLYKYYMDRFILGIYDKHDSKKILRSLTDGYNSTETLMCILKIISKFNVELTEELVQEFIENNSISKQIFKITDNDLNFLILELDDESVKNLNLLFSVNKRIVNESIDKIELPIISADDYISNDNDEMFFKYSNLIPSGKLFLQQELELARRIKNGNKHALDIIVMYNQKMILKLIKNYMSDNISFLDLLQIGNLILMEAINKYDINSGFKLSTWAYFYVNRKIESRIFKYFDVELSKFPNELEYIECYSNWDQNFKFVIESNSSLAQQYEMKDLRKRLLKVMDDLGFNEREKLIFYYHYGFLDNKVKTLTELGDMFGITKSRISKIKNDKLNEMRHYINVTGEFVDYYVPKKSFFYSSVSPYIEKMLSCTNSGRCLSDIKDYYSKYGTNNFYLMLNKLTDNEIDILFKLYGDEFANLNFEGLNDEEYQYFFEHLVPRMTRILEYLSVKNNSLIKK